MTTTLQKIEEMVTQKGQTTAKELREELGVSQVLIHRHLKRLCTEQKIQKRGTPPKVYYLPKTPLSKSNPLSHSKIVEENWLEILPNGTFLYGNKGFTEWCRERNFDPLQKEKEYEAMFMEKEEWKKYGIIDATKKIEESFETCFLRKVWYIDFYSWEIFGKTLLGKLILYAKQNSDITLMKRIAERVGPPLQALLARENIQHIGLIPHSVPRRENFLRKTLSFLFLPVLPEGLFDKIFADHVVAQKTLKSKKEREQNAQETLFLQKKALPEKILLIDDACGSGSTLNIAAQKICVASPKTQVFGIAFVGSIKGFEVIAES